ncbi:streptomycin 6-kinase [Actinokineospora baliensis]|uniref:aminoglycoside phosphotransferase family protein n=1 Tax=Actinokineospora baliensis TaxID=547056 RepID=UPI001959D4B5|nr:aminoglycoside phosphotransferase family protein [Actinokineospora baliensis]MBM7771202.1 streptomycin 6-kinase [Actinokineospora baliensis]
MQAIAERQGIHIVGYHDSGWTSIVAIGEIAGHRRVALKALPDRNRFERELTALRHWGGRGTAVLLDADEDAQILIIGLVGGRAGGVNRPPDHTSRVARALPELHRHTAQASRSVPTLTDYYSTVVVPRMVRRSSRLAHLVGAHRVDTALALAQSFGQSQFDLKMLHADLYQENILFNNRREAVFIDPHALMGTPAFDWAFWAIYYDRFEGFELRVSLCEQNTPDLFEETLQWVITIAIDGALYYIDVGDHESARALLLMLDHPMVAACGGWV